MKTYINKIYLQLFIYVFLLYIIFNKGVSYTFLTEFIVIIGILLTINLNKNKFVIYFDNNYAILLFLLIVGFLYFIYGIYNYKINGVIQDSLFFLYISNVFILLTFTEYYDTLIKLLFNIYKWVPVIGIVNFILQNYSSFFENYSAFGGLPLMLYKYGDLGVNLAISTLLFLENKYSLNKTTSFLFALLIIINLLIVLTYSRSGFIAYAITLFCYYIFSNNIKKGFLKKNIKFVFFTLIIAIPLYTTFEVKENFQGRTTGLNQIINNINSFISSSSEFKFNNTLNNNIIWRFAWWSNIIENSINEKMILIGVGSGADLIKDAGVLVEDTNLRAPHSIHFNILARYGILFFFVWIAWIFLTLRPLFLKKLDGDNFLLTLFLLAFLINASFDVYLEGPMGGLPFWVWVGLLLMKKNKKILLIAKS